MNGCISKGQISEHVVRKGPLASCPHHPCCPGHFLEGCKCEIWRQAAHALHEMVITKDHNCSLVLGRAGHLTVKHALSRASTFVQQLNFGGQHLKLTNPAVKLQEAFSVSFWLTFQWNLKQSHHLESLAGWDHLLDIQRKLCVMLNPSMRDRHFCGRTQR